MATHSSILAWRIPWTEEPVGYSPWGHRVGHDWAHTHTHTHTEGCWNMMGPAIPSSWFGRCLSTSLSCGIDKNVLRLVLSRNTISHHYSRASLVAGSVVGNPPANAGDTGSIPDAGRSHMPVDQLCHNYWACALELRSHNYWAHVLQLQKPTSPRAPAL